MIRQPKIRKSQPLFVHKILGFPVGLTLLVLCSCGGSSSPAFRHEADTLSKEERYDEAVAAYWQHIRYRLSVKNRPEWENPYIYLLDIGDVYLKKGDVNEALKNYDLAESKGVRQGYVNDRYRFVARWYEERHEFQKAIDLLKRYQERDPVLFDLMLDRISKRMLFGDDPSAPLAPPPSPSTTPQTTQQLP